MKDENDWMGEFEDELKADGGDRGEFNRRLRQHIALSQQPRGWPRVLRRFYTNARRLKDPYLLTKWPQHLDQTPDSVRSVFDYLATFRLTQTRVRLLLETLDHFGTVYEDFEILAHEYVCVAPCQRSLVLKDEIADWAISIVRREAEARPRIAAAATVTVGKFGADQYLDELRAIYDRQRRDTAFRTQAAMVLAGSTRIGRADLSRLLVRSRLETIETLEFVLAIMDGEAKAIGMALSALAPVQRFEPKRYVLKPRLLFLAPLVRGVAGGRWTGVSNAWKLKLRSNPAGLRDHVGEAWLFGQT
jgi:hypothetical protein